MRFVAPVGWTDGSIEELQGLQLESQLQLVTADLLPFLFVKPFHTLETWKSDERCGRSGPLSDVRLVAERCCDSLHSLLVDIKALTKHRRH